jgi:peptide/nickel transport system permease protein
VLAVAALVSALTFWMTQLLPGNEAFRVAAARYDAERLTSETTERVRNELGLDAPGSRRLLRWMAALATGGLGRSAVTEIGVARTIAAPLGRTLLLVGVAWPLLLVLGVAAGAAMARSSAGMAVATAAGALASGVPSYVLGLGLAGVFAIGLRWLPAGGYGGGAHLALPAATLALLGGMRLAVVTARACATAAADPSVGFARMKAVGPIAVTVLHILPLAAPAVIAYAFVSLALLLEGAAVIETVFAYPGIGRLMVDAVQTRDIPVVQGAALVVGVMVVSANSAADALAGSLSRLVGRG